jgi:type VI secretion system protein ImpF
MRKQAPSREHGAPLMSAFREAFAARDAKKRVIQTVGGERVVPGRHSTQRRGDELALRRDLSIDLGYVRRSILNYGLNDVGRLTSEDAQIELIKDDLRTALTQFEPRLNPETILIERDEDVDEGQRVRFTVAVEMFARPMDLSVDFIAEVDVGSGKISLSRLPDVA